MAKQQAHIGHCTESEYENLVSTQRIIKDTDVYEHHKTSGRRDGKTGINCSQSVVKEFSGDQVKISCVAAKSQKYYQHAGQVSCGLYSFRYL